MEIKRYNPEIEKGLTAEQVNERMQDKLYNYDTTVSTKSIKAIILGNIFTIFNLLNFALAIAVFCVGSYKNLFFMGIVICNTLISTYQEIHSKRVIDKLSIIASAKVKAIRDSKEELISINDIVLDDILKFETGNQVVVDVVIKSGTVDVNESFITGEQETIHKKIGDTILSRKFYS